MLDVLRHDDSVDVLKGPASSQALKTTAVQRERLKGGEDGRGLTPPIQCGLEDRSSVAGISRGNSHRLRFSRQFCACHSNVLQVVRVCLLQAQRQGQTDSVDGRWRGVPEGEAGFRQGSRGHAHTQGSGIEGVQWLATATCEKGFSLRTQILTAQRHRMGDSLLAYLMMICSNGPSLHEKEEVKKFLLAVVA